MSTYTVVSSRRKKTDIPGKYGVMQEIEMVLRNEAGIEKAVEWYTKASTSLPTPGTSVEGEVKPDDKFPDKLKFKKAQQQGGNYNGGGRGHSPEERVSIERQVAAKCATDLIVAWLPTGPGASVDLDTLLGWHKKLASGIAEGIKS